MESNDNVSAWKTLKYGNTQQTGPARAIEAEAKALAAKGVDYTIEDFLPAETKVRKTRKTVENLDLEVRDENN